MVADGHRSWPDWGRQIAEVVGGRHAPVLAGALLGAAAAAEALARSWTASSDFAGALALAVLALCTTVPLAFLGPAAAAVSVCLASVLSLTAFRTMTVAGLAAVLIALYRLGSAAGRDGVSSWWRRRWPCRS